MLPKINVCLFIYTYIIRGCNQCDSIYNIFFLYRSNLRPILSSPLPVIRFDLKSEKFTSTKLYNRTLKALNERLRKFTVILAWDPPRNQICPSSIAKYFSVKGYTVWSCTPTLCNKTEYQVAVPIFREPPEESCEPHEVVEWLGMLALKADYKNGKPDSFTNTYQIPEPSAKFGQVKYFEWRGLFTKKQIEKLYNGLK